MKNQTTEKPNWQAKWIGVPGVCFHNWQAETLPAPFFRKAFSFGKGKGRATVCICGLGYYELYLNGRKVGDHVLDPVVTNYDKRVRYVVYDVTDDLVDGRNVVGVVLGNGWYNCHTADVWHFDKASWRDYPKLLLQMEVGNETVLCSDATWKTTTGPILFDGLRNGETYDARLELGDWLSPEYDESEWKDAKQANPPGGIMQRQTMPSCKVMQTLPASSHWTPASGETVYDFGQNMAGWVRISVAGPAGSELVIRYADILSGQEIDQSDTERFILGGDCQTDRYILKGDGIETWEPRFTYHGFRYVSIGGKADIKAIEGRVVHTAFEKTGKFSCSDERVNRLQKCTVWSYIGNFTGIPTDCPQREKNGWTGDAHLAAETGLFNFSAGDAYAHWIDSVADCQRPSGQLPGIVPSTGWGYNWGSGPAWDSALLLIPWYVYVYTGDSSAIETHYPAMRKYVDYCSSMATEGIVSFGLGDWNHVDKTRMVDAALTSTGYYYIDALMLARFAELTGRADDQKKYSRLAERIKAAFNREFYRGGGIYANGEMTASACALYQGLVRNREENQVVARLAAAVEANACKVDFGILGAKYIPRALAEHGHVELAYRIITQPEFPGWMYWLECGATTLWERWQEEGGSKNHIMFGDVSAWMYQYLAGIVPDPAHPGFSHVTIKPHPVDGLSWVQAEHESPLGRISSHWKWDSDLFSLEVGIPDGTTGTVVMPDGKRHRINPGKHSFSSHRLNPDRNC